MNRTFTVKSVGGNQETITIGSEENFESFCDTIRTVFHIDSDRRLKLICNGQIVNSERFTSLVDKSTVVCLATRPVRDTASTSESAPGSTPEPTSEVSTDTAGETSAASQLGNSGASTEETYTFKQVQAYTIVFMNFISSNPQLRNAFLNDYGLLVTELAKNETLTGVMKNILSQAGQIAEAMDKGENIKVNINTDSNEMEKIELTPDDEKKIDQLIAMGFNPDKVVVAYLQSNKDIQATLQVLQSDSN